MKKLLGWTTVAMSAATVITCFGPQVNALAKTAAAPVTITVWSQGTDDTVDGVTKEFERLHPNIKVDIVKQPMSNYATLERAAVAAKRGPDIVENYAVQLLNYYQGLIPLTQYVTPEQRKDLSGWSLGSLGLKESGALYGVPWGATGNLWYYNKALFKKAGLNPNNPPTTWAQLLADCQKLKAAGIVPIAGGFKDGYYAEWYLEQFGEQFMTPSELADFPAHSTWTNPALAKGLSYMVDLVKKGYMSPNAIGTPLFPDTVNNFMAGKAAIIIGNVANNTNFSEFEPALKSNLGAFLTPVLPGSLYKTPRLNWSPTYFWSIAKWSQHPREAYEWISFLTNANSQREGFQKAGMFPNNSLSSLKSNDPLVEEIVQWSKDSSIHYIGPDDVMQANPEATFDQLVPAVVGGQQTIQAMLQQVQQTQDRSPAIPGTN